MLGRIAIDIALPPAGCSGFVFESVTFSLSCFVTLCVLFREARFHQPADEKVHEKVQIRWSGVPLFTGIKLLPERKRGDGFLSKAGLSSALADKASETHVLS